jgi:glycosyltransferase involved in cell wall biosynthesis
VLIITNMYPPHHYGGYELACHEVATHLRSRGHEILVLSTGWRVPGVPDGTEESEAGILRVLDFYWDDHRLRSPVIPRRLAIERANQRHLRRALDSFSPDVVSVWHMGAMSLGLLTTLAEHRLPMVYLMADDWLIYGPTLDAWARLFADRPRVGRAVRRLTGVPTVLPDLPRTGQFCFVSDCTRRRADDLSRWRFPEAAVVPLGVNLADFPILEGSEADRPWRWRLVYVGRMDDRKGIDTLVRTLALLPPEASLKLVGRGDDRYQHHLLALARELGVADQLSFGVTGRAELAGVYREADVVVFPSTWEEPFGLVPLEAMACATPVVATGTGGSAEFLEDEVNCLYFAAGDTGSLASAVLRLAGDGALRRRLVQSGFKTAGRLTTVRLAEDMESRLQAAAGTALGRSEERSPGTGSPRY